MSQQFARIRRFARAGNHAANALNELGWEPESINDKVHHLVAKRDGYQLILMWDDTKQVLLNDANSDNNDAIQNALFAFISIGKKEIIPELISILETKGTKTRAIAYLNCGNKELSSAAKAWANKNGYQVLHSGGSSPVGWGGW